MTKLDPNKVWEIANLVIKENIESNEAISTMGNHEAVIKYSVISSNTLYERSTLVNMETLRQMSVPTLRIFIKEIIQNLRYDTL